MLLRAIARSALRVCLLLPLLVVPGGTWEAPAGRVTVRPASVHHDVPPHHHCSQLRDVAEEDDSDHLGTKGDDLIEGGDDTDIVHAQGGDDVVFGRGGSDLLCGGRGDDLVLGGLGDDFVNGGSGSDSVFGGWGDDR
ncbi:MAG: calcium-binding protein, partial [Actinomycetota bacterium]